MPHAEDSPSAHPVEARPCEALHGRIAAPGDKSISHRTLILGGLTVGETAVEGLLEGEDVLATARAMRAYGAQVERIGAGSWRIHGRGVGGLHEPEDVLDMGNAGTGLRLMMGLAAGYGFTSFFTGDASLRRRPMGRVARPLERMGATIVSRSRDRAPLAITGAVPPVAIDYAVPVPSAQVKSAVLLAGLHAPGATTIVEREATRDHSERMLRAFGAQVGVEAVEGATRISLQGQPELRPTAIRVPGDPSSAAFPLVAAACLPGSQVTIMGVGMNPMRIGLIETLIEMGADIAVQDPRDEGGEPVADLFVRGGRLRGVEVPAHRAPSMIDEYPVLSVAAACAQGRTVMTGLAELRIKESDRLAVMAAGLAANGVAVEELEDGLIVTGRGGRPAGGATIATHLDHRIAMSFLVLGLLAEQPVTIDDIAPVATSFPGFLDLMSGLGARFGA